MTKDKKSWLPQQASDAVRKVELNPLYLFPTDRADDARLLDLFDEFGYDVGDISHWRWLIIIFANRYFAQKHGHPAKWTEASRQKLFVDWLVMGKAGLLEGNRENEAALIQRHHKLDPLYKNTPVKEIYKNLLKCIREMEKATSPSARR